MQQKLIDGVVILLLFVALFMFVMWVGVTFPKKDFEGSSMIIGAVAAVWGYKTAVKKRNK